MRVSKLLLIALVMLAAHQSTEAQRSRRITKSRYHFSSPKIRGRKAKIICPAFDKGRYPFHGFGFKLGDPFAITYKFYPNKRLSFALDVGTAASGLYRDYFREKFYFYVREDAFSPDETNVTYLTHRVVSDLVSELKALYHVDAARISEGLQGYFGAGWQWKSTHLIYDYEHKRENNAPPLEDPFGSFERHRTTMGPEVVAGIEYSYFRIPVAASMEVEYFTDIRADPGWQRFSGGVGLRYIF